MSEMSPHDLPPGLAIERSDCEAKLQSLETACTYEISLLRELCADARNLLAQWSDIDYTAWQERRYALITRMDNANVY